MVVSVNGSPPRALKRLLNALETVVLMEAALLGLPPRDFLEGVGEGGCGSEELLLADKAEAEAEDEDDDDRALVFPGYADEKSSS